jgi:hypothetical protein
MRILTTSKRLIAFAAVLAGVALATPNQARADLDLTWSPAPGLIGSSPSDSFITGVNSTSGTFTVTGSAVGTGSGVFGPGVAGLDLSTISVTSSGPGTLTLYLTENSQTSPVGFGILTASVTGQFLAGSGSVSLVAYGNDTNALYGNGLAGGITPPIGAPTNVATPAAGLNAPATGVTFDSISPYSLTEILTINFASAGVVSLSSDSRALFSTPEPGTIAMALTALPLLGLGAWARRRRTVA